VGLRSADCSPVMQICGLREAGNLHNKGFWAGNCVTFREGVYITQRRSIRGDLRRRRKTVPCLMTAAGDEGLSD
jgi:hypothetical protein